MARPRKEGLDYFSHDTDAAGDEKIDAMRAMFGNDGYAFFFILCERIFRSDTPGLDISKPILKSQIVKKIGVTESLFDEMMQAALEVKLFDRESFENGIITSSGIKSRYAKIQSMRKTWRKNKETKEETSELDEFSEELPKEFSSEKTIKKMPESKVKQSKEKISNTTTTEDDFFTVESEPTELDGEIQKAQSAYYEIHKQDISPRDWPDFSKVVKEFGAEHVIETMRVKNASATGRVTTFRYYLAAIKEPARQYRSRVSGIDWDNI